MADFPEQQLPWAQPKYGNIAQHFRGLADEAALIPNIPFIDNGQQIIALLNQVIQGQNQIRQDIVRKHVYELLL